MSDERASLTQRGRTAARNMLVGAMLLSLSAPQAGAWGREGHRLTALVAEQYLNRAARLQIAELLRTGTLADIASWADDYRVDHPETARWHYVDIPGSAPGFDRDRDCPVSPDPKSGWRDCVSDRILYFEKRLGDTSLSPSDRAIALKFVVHLIGDIHQPFHALGDARGGNDIRVAFLGSQQCGTRPCNLHGIWDDGIIEQQGLKESKYTERLLDEIRANHWERFAGGDPVAWANASHRYAVLAEAPNGAILMRDYEEQEAGIVDAELALGGLRLAAVLNRILGTGPEPTGPELKTR